MGIQKTGTKRGVRYDRNTWKFDQTQCPYCGRSLRGNWLVRHIRKEHSNVVSLPTSTLANSSK